MSGSKTRKKPSANRRRTTTKHSNTGSKQFESSLLKDILLIVLFAICLFLFISCFGIGGVAGSFISNFLFGIFGLLAYLVPWLLFIGLLVLISNQGSTRSIIKFIAGVFFVISLSSFVWLVMPAFSVDYEVAEYFILSMEAKSYGGFFGGVLAKFLCSFLGGVGAFVIVILIIIVTSVIISEQSFITKMMDNRERTKERVKKEPKEPVEHTKSTREIRREERRLNKAEFRLRQEEEWEEEKHRRQEDMLRRQKALAEKKGNVTFDTKLTPPSETETVLPVPEPEKPVVKKPKKEMSLEETLRSQTMTEIKMPDSEEYIEPIIEEPVVEPDPIPEMHIIENDNKPEEFINPEPIQRPVFEDNIVEFEPKDNFEEFEPQDDAIDYEPEEMVKPSKSSVKENDNVIEISNEDMPEYEFPPLRFLKKSTGNNSGDSKSHQMEMGALLVSTLQSFGVNVRLTDTTCGPTVTRYELQPEKGVKVSKILSLSDDIKLSLAASDIRIEAPIPGKAAIGIEVPNKNNVAVMLGDLLSSPEFENSKSKLTFAVGKDIGGKVVVSDIAKMPHLLIAGATGSGKSVCLNTLIMSILYKARPDEVKLIMIDPKVVELSVYNGIPHLMIPVVTDPKKASGALNWAVMEMTNRYKAFADYGVRDLKGFNEKMESIKGTPEYNEELHKKMPQILIAVDELADLMMVAAREVEDSICRLAQLARAAGIHLIIATQRPSVDVITGLIKANMPSRLALAVSSGTDSRTILDSTGAEKLLGNGDMLFYPQGYQKPVRIQGAYISDAEVSAIAGFLKDKNKLHSYSKDVEEQINSASTQGGMSQGGGDKDDLFIEAAQLIIDSDKASIGMLQRKLRIGFNRAARIMDQLADAGVVGPEEGTKPRTILMSMEQFEQYIEESF